MDVLQALAASSLFQGVPPAQFEPLVPLAREERVRAGNHIFRLGDRAERLFIIRSGIVHLTMPIAVNGNERDVVVQEAREGETVGWSALVEPYRFTMSAAAGNDVELIAFSTRELQAVVEACPGAGLRIMANLARVIATRLQVMHTMWMRELQRAVSETFG
jgi:CRP-like cAMP-binding protein